MTGIAVSAAQHFAPRSLSHGPAMARPLPVEGSAARVRAVQRGTGLLAAVALHLGGLCVALVQWSAPADIAPVVVAPALQVQWLQPPSQAAAPTPAVASPPAATKPAPPPPTPQVRKTPAPTPRQVVERSVAAESPVQQPAAQSTPSPSPAAETAPAQTAVAPAAAPAPAVTPATDAGQNTPAAASTPARFDAAYLNNPEPNYPPASRVRGEQGTVQLRVKVGVDGRSLSVAVAKSSGFDRLDRAAENAVLSQWRFVPAQRNGQAVEGTVIVPITFHLQ